MYYNQLLVVFDKSLPIFLLMIMLLAVFPFIKNCYLPALTLQGQNQVATGNRKPKTNFVEIRTFWHLYRSFDRMWIFFVLALQVS